MERRVACPARRRRYMSRIFIRTVFIVISIVRRIMKQFNGQREIGELIRVRVDK